MQTIFWLTFDSFIVAELSFAVDVIFIILMKTMIKAISIKCDSMKFMNKGEPLLGSKRDSG